MDLQSIDQIKEWFAAIAPWATPFIIDHSINKSPLKSNSMIELISVLIKKFFLCVRGHIIFLLSFFAAMSFVSCLFFLLITLKKSQGEK